MRITSNTTARATIDVRACSGHARRDAIDRLVASLVADDVATLTEPHIVLICDPYVAELSAYGPFTDALAAATVAEELRDQMIDSEHRCAVDAVVIPLRAFERGVH